MVTAEHHMEFPAWRYHLALLLMLAIGGIVYWTGNTRRLAAAVQYISATAHEHDLVISDDSGRSRLTNCKARVLYKPKPSMVQARYFRNIYYLSSKEEQPPFVHSDTWSCKTFDFKPYNVHACANPLSDVTVLYSFPDEIKKSKVFFEDGQKKTRCRFDREGKCTFPPHSWRYVGVRSDLVFEGIKRQCIWAHPDAERRLCITFPHVPRGDGAVFSWGFPDSSHHPDNPPLQLLVEADGKAMFRGEIVHQHSWHTQKITMDSLPAQVNLSLCIWAADVGAKHFCFDGYTYTK